MTDKIDLSIDKTVSGLHEWSWGDEIPEYLAPACIGAATIVLEQIREDITGAYLSIDTPDYRVGMALLECGPEITFSLKELIEEVLEYGYTANDLASFAKYLRGMADKFDLAAKEQ